VKLFDAKGDPAQALGAITNEYGIFLIMLATVGFLMSIFAFFSIRSAAIAITAVKNDWLNVIKDHPDNCNWYLELRVVETRGLRERE
jgi:hypothetical protein